MIHWKQLLKHITTPARFFFLTFLHPSSLTVYRETWQMVQPELRKVTNVESAHFSKEKCRILLCNTVAIFFWIWNETALCWNCHVMKFVCSYCNRSQRSRKQRKRESISNHYLLTTWDHVYTDHEIIPVPVCTSYNRAYASSIIGTQHVHKVMYIAVGLWMHYMSMMPDMHV